MDSRTVEKLFFFYSWSNEKLIICDKYVVISAVETILIILISIICD